jgi:hypothetical protein
MSFRINPILLLLLAFTTIVGSSCVKNDVKELGDAGRTYIKFLEAPEQKLFFEPFTGTKSVNLFSLRRDANSNAALNQSVTVSLKVDTAALRAYNTAHSTTFELLPDSLITVPAGFTKTGPLTYTTTFAPGEFAKEFTVALNGSKWNLSHTYAMPFTIQDAGGVIKSADKGDYIPLISVKNKYDGKYEVTGTMEDAGAALTGLFPFNYYLITTGPNSVAGYDPDYWDDYFIPIMSGGSVSGYGSFSPIFTFDANNKITSVVNRYGQPAGNGRYAQLDPSGVNAYDPATKTIQVKFFMFQPSVVPLPNPRVKFDWTLTYKGPR